MLDLSGSRFDREVYFRFTEFRGHTDFHRALFRNTVDFTEARFQGDVDFREAVFEHPNLLSGIELPELGGKGGPTDRDRDFFILLGILAGLWLLLLAMWKRKSR